MEVKSCFFIGHRDASPTVFPALAETVELHSIEYGVTEFIVGHYGSFDRMAARAVIKAKARHPDITLTMLLPYHPAERPVPLSPGFDNSFYPPGMETIPRKLAILRANRYMVDHVDYLIAFAWHPGSNARTLIEYAEKRNDLQICKLYEIERNRELF